MHNHGHSGSREHVHKLMRGMHHALGGPATAAGHTMGPNTPNYMPGVKKGGGVSRHRHHRRHHAEGEGVNPVTGDKLSPTIAKYRGGRACHAEGDIVATPMRKGGKSRHHRRHHADGGMEAMHAGPWMNMPNPMYKAEGGKTEGMRKGGCSKPRPFNAMRRHPAYAEGGKAEAEKEMTLRRGGRSHRRRHHDEGDEVEAMRRGGHKKKA